WVLDSFGNCWPQTELHDLSPVAFIGLALQEASPTSEGSHTPQSGRETGPSGPSPGACTSHDRARVAACADCVWQHDVCPEQALPYASGACAATDRHGGDQLSVAPRLVSGLWALEENPGPCRACHRLRTPVQCAGRRSGRDLWEQPTDGANLVRFDV